MLQQFLVSQLFGFLLLFFRIGAGIMLLPGFGEAYVLARARLAIAIMLSLVLLPVIGPMLPPVPTNPLSLFLMITSETLIGAFIGGLSRILISTMHMAGMMIAYQSGLASAVLFDITQATQGSAIGNMLSLMAVVLLFALDLHHLMLRALVDSYGLFPPGTFPPVGDFAYLASNLLNKCFVISIQFATPLLVLGLIFYTAAGVLARLMPTMQVFFILISPQLLMSFFILMAILSASMMWYMRFYEETLMGFLSP